MNPAQREERAKFKQAIRNRITLIAGERGLPESETARVMGRLKHYDLLCFSQRHRVDIEWLITGNLKGLLETARGCPSRPPALDPWYEVGLLLRKLGDQKLLPAAVECLRLILERCGAAS